VPLRNAIARVAAYTLAAALLAASCAPAAERASQNLPEGLYAVIETDRGVIVISLDTQGAPQTVRNFVALAEGELSVAKGIPWYDGLTFHRVEKGFLIQGGDPKGNGLGDAGYTIANEPNANASYSRAGVVGMANKGPDTNSCQFFITLKPLDLSPSDYPVFGEVVSGLDVAARVEPRDVMRKVTIVRKGEAAEAFASDQAAWEAGNAALQELKGRLLREELAAAAAKQAEQLAARWPDLVDGPGGLRYRILLPGKGGAIGPNRQAKVLYKGMLPDGTVFDASELHGNVPFGLTTGPSGQVIEGWKIIVPLMAVGERRVVAIPPELGYGDRGVPGQIPARSWLVFEIEVVSAE
jgi:peptidylprolyl isomerase